ncbi:MAG: tripartite tricarboxylate transporter substrate binding protein [Xanthobacteraceae bacterium]
MKKIIPLLVAICALMLPVHGQAQSWPTRPVRLIVPYPAGGNADIVARIVGNALQANLHEPFVVENKGGAGGIVGAMAVIQAAPDGYTLLLSADGPILFAPELAPERPYEWDKAFTPVSLVALTPLVVVVNPRLPVRTFAEFVDYARKEGDKLTFAAGGLGTTNHLFSEYMQDKLKLKWTTVQYKGTAPAMADLMGGQVQFSIDQVSSAAPFIEQGAVRALGVASDHRLSVLPDVPTLAELGYKDLIGNTFTALMAPAGTPKDVLAKLHAALLEAAKDPKFREDIQRLGAEVTTMTPEDSKAFLERESATWIPIVRKLNPAPH